MAARKLQTEIDRTLKKVSEGVELFESIYDKMQASTNQTQKEKLETDLKTQIKKLQRLRDSIKSWVASNDIKDKSHLLENRRLIETQMEKFKACEKEMKTKAFSKEGLIQATRLDPKEQEKEEATQWLQSQVEELQMQVESTEAEIESLQGTGKKRNKGSTTAAGRLEDLEQLNDRRKWHISRLELVLRLLNNGSMSPDKVFALKDDVQYFVESNTDENFKEDEGIYDELNLDEEEEKFGLGIQDEENSDESDDASEDLPPRTPSKKYEEDTISISKREESPVLKKAGVSLSMRKASVDVKPPPNINFAQQPMASVVKGINPPARPPAILPPIRYAAAAAAAITPQATSQPPPSATTASTPTIPSAAAPSSSTSQPPGTPSLPPATPQISNAIPSVQDQISRVPPSPSLTHQSTISPLLSSSASQQPDGSFYSGLESPALSEAIQQSIASPQQPVITHKDSSAPSPPPVAPSTSPELVAQSSGDAIQPVVAPQVAPSPVVHQLQQLPPTPITTAPPVQVTATQPQFPPGVKVLPSEQATSQQQNQAVGQRPDSSLSQSGQQGRTRQTSSAFPGSLQDLVVAFEGVKQKAPLRMNDLDQVHKMLEGGYSSIPQPRDTENRPKFYTPRNPFTTASYYPQEPLPLLSTTSLFSQLDVETLFYVFYFLPGTYQQFLAARELKRQSWRFHVKYLTWFQRHSEPQAITEEYEQGVYVYFDWEGSWCQRKKADFRFEYRYLSED